MNYLVTGGAGFIGSFVSKKLLSLGHEVTIIDNLSTGLKSNIPKLARFIEGDASRAETINKLNSEKFDAILHIAGQSSGEISFEDPVYDLNSNTTSTILLLDYSLKTNCKRFIYASTMSVYGEKEGKEQFSETDSPNPKSFYAVGKLASENYLKIYHQQYGIDYTILRYFNVYGEGQNLSNMKQGMVSIFFKQILDDSFDVITVKGDLNRFRDQVHVEDIANITIESIGNEKFKNDVVNIGSGVKTSVENVILAIQSLTNSTKKVVQYKGTPGDQFGIYADNTKLLKLIDYKFLSFDQGILRMINWIENK